MASSPKSVRKSVTFDGSDRAQSLLSAVEAELQKNEYGSFSELCKAALYQFLASREPSQSVFLFMDLARQVIALQERLARIEEKEELSIVERLSALESQIAQLDKAQSDEREQPSEKQTAETVENNKLAAEPSLPSLESDPLLARLVPLLEDF
ncbi:MAG: hypothetical protein WBD47_01715 [Phormidesmis sp.]